MPLPFVDRASSALPVQLVPQPKWKAWLKEQTAARRAWLESSGLSGKAGDFSVFPGRDGKAAGAVLVLSAKPVLWDVGALATRLPAGTWKLADTASLSPTDAAVAIGLGSWRFERYKAKKGKPGPKIVWPQGADKVRATAIVEALIRAPIDQGSTHFQPTSLQFTTIDVGNSATNIAPGVVKARFNTRFNDLWTSQKLLAHLKERIEQANARLGGNGTVEYAKVEVSGESFYTQPGPLVDLVAGAIREVTGIDPELSTTGGTSDARFIARYCPVLEFGLVGESMHKVDEKSAVADLKALARVYEAMLDRFFAT